MSSSESALRLSGRFSVRIATAPSRSNSSEEAIPTGVIKLRLGRGLLVFAVRSPASLLCQRHALLGLGAEGTPFGHGSLPTRHFQMTASYQPFQNHNGFIYGGHFRAQFSQDLSYVHA